MAVNDIYQLTDFQTIGGQQIENVYFYRQTAADGAFPSAKALVDLWNSQVRIAVTNIQYTGCVHNRYQAINLFSLAELYDVLDSDAGAIAGDVQPFFVAWGFGAPRSDREIRKSTRRIGGVMEVHVTNGVATAPAIALLNTMATAFNAVLNNGVVGGSNNFVPVAVKRIKVTPSIGKPYYRLPTSLAEATYRTITNWAYERVTTQSSRKPGHGA